MLTITRRAVVAGAGLLACAGLGAVALTATSRPSNATSHLSARQIAIANTVARFEANGTTPAAPGIVQKTAIGHWPANVTGVTALVTNRQRTARWVGLSKAEDNRAVVVVQLRGEFSVMTTAPPPPGRRSGVARANVVTGTEEIAVADAVTGEILDFAVNDVAVALPRGISLYAVSR
jgi:hypothetical protein